MICFKNDSYLRLQRDSVIDVSVTPSQQHRKLFYWCHDLETYIKEVKEYSVLGTIVADFLQITVLIDTKIGMICEVLICTYRYVSHLSI